MFAKSIKVDTNYTRSINVERDCDTSDVLRAFVPTSRAFHTVGRVIDGISAESKPRAWSLTGPYGSGKSMFSLFLAHLLEKPAESNTKLALKKLRA